MPPKRKRGRPPAKKAVRSVKQKTANRDPSSSEGESDSGVPEPEKAIATDPETISEKIEEAPVERKKRGRVPKKAVTALNTVSNSAEKGDDSTDETVVNKPETEDVTLVVLPKLSDKLPPSSFETMTSSTHAAEEPAKTPNAGFVSDDLVAPSSSFSAPPTFSRTYSGDRSTAHEMLRAPMSRGPYTDHHGRQISRHNSADSASKPGEEPRWLKDLRASVLNCEVYIFGSNVLNHSFCVMNIDRSS